MEGVLCAYDADTREVEGGGPKVQGHPYLHAQGKPGLHETLSQMSELLDR